MLGVYRNFIELISYQGHILLLYFFINTKKNKRKTQSFIYVYCLYEFYPQNKKQKNSIKFL